MTSRVRHLQIETCRQVENLLRRKAKGLGRVLACHAAIREDVREANMDAFLERPTGPADRLALVCTDR